MWYPEIQNRIAQVEAAEAHTICSLLDKYLVPPAMNVTSESQVFFSSIDLWTKPLYFLLIANQVQ